MLSGSCLCGAVAYEIDADLPGAITCHCRQCRKQSGHVFSAVPAPREALRMIREDALRWYRHTDIATRGFCARCGSSLFWDGGGPNMAIFAGGFDAEEAGRRQSAAGPAERTVDLGEGCELGPVLENHFNPLVRAIRRSRLIVISAVNGPCAGVSVGLALAADIVLAADDAFFYEPFAEVALVPDGGNTLFIPRAAGRVRALSMMLLGEKIGAGEARDWGLVWAVHPANALLAKARDIADRVAALPPLAARRTKQLVSAATDDALDAQLDLERDYQAELSNTAEMIAAVSQFLGRT